VVSTRSGSVESLSSRRVAAHVHHYAAFGAFRARCSVLAQTRASPSGDFEPSGGPVARSMRELNKYCLKNPEVVNAIGCDRGSA
jgi:hypothetical protein